MCPLADANTDSNASGNAGLRLAGSLQIKDVEIAHRLLAGWLEGSTKLSVDVSGLYEVDTAGVQLLLAFKQECARRAVAFELTGDSAPLAQALQLLGLSDALLGRIS